MSRTRTRKGGACFWEGGGASSGQSSREAGGGLPCGAPAAPSPRARVPTGRQGAVAWSPGRSCGCEGTWLELQRQVRTGSSEGPRFRFFPGLAGKQGLGLSWWGSSGTWRGAKPSGAAAASGGGGPVVTGHGWHEGADVRKGGR
ncbi:hypothetical protein ES705_30562 [subsurface metagenome]